MAKKRRSKSSGSADVFTIDFSKEVEGGGGGVRVPENDYKLKILKLKKIRASEKDTPGLQITVKIVEGKYKDKKITDRMWITPKSLWRIRSLLEALGLEVPKKALKIPSKKLIGKEVGATVVDDAPYKGKIRSKIGDWIDLETLADLDDEDEDDEEYDDEDSEDVDDDEDEEDDEEEEDDEDDEDDEDEEDDDLEEMDRKELKEYIKENELDVKVTKKMDEDDIREAISEANDEDEDELDLDEL